MGNVLFGGGLPPVNPPPGSGFAGAATVQLVADGEVRITGLAVQNASTGTLSLAAGAGDIKLPAAAEVYGGYAGVTLQDAIQVRIVQAGVVVTTPVPLVIVKTGTKPSDFLISITNPSNTTSDALEIYVTFHT